MSNATLRFLGAAGTVTGSRHLLEIGHRRILLDCGLFQGLKELRLRNWADPPFDPRQIDAVVLSHAHVDHTGYLPLLYRRGFRGRVYSTHATRALSRILLPDSAKLQEEQAAHANRHGYSKHRPALPLYTSRDAEACLRLFKARAFDEWFEVSPEVHVRYRPAGHIPGSAIMEIDLGRKRSYRLVFSGDLGRGGHPLLVDPFRIRRADGLLVESTYGNRDHPTTDIRSELERIVNETVSRRGVLLVPAFAVGRTQELIWYLRELEDAERIPVIPVYVDSPMATDVTDMFCDFPRDLSPEMRAMMDAGRCPLCSRKYSFTRSQQESRELNDRSGPMVIIAGSGMATGGRILFHLENRLPDPRNTVLLVGFQAAGTRGRSLQDGAEAVKMHGRYIPVKARVEVLHGLSAHAGRSQLLNWLHGFDRPPRQTWIVHGEPDAAGALQNTLHEEWGWNAAVAGDQQKVTLF